jgi:6-phosphogluconolactonase
MATSRGRDVHVFGDLEALSAAAAQYVADLSRASVRDRGRFSVALAGGNTPKATYALLAGRHLAEIEWASWQVFFGDERFVPRDDDRSNYKMASQALLTRAPIPESQIHPIPTDAPTVGDAANAYERTLSAVLAGTGAQPPVIDLALLGVGPDGHTASLFPGSPVLDEEAHWARAVDAPTTVQPAVPRVTLTLPVLNAARHVLFLVAGADKRPVISEILEAGDSARRYPAARVAGADRTWWLIEQSAFPSGTPGSP